MLIPEIIISIYSDKHWSRIPFVFCFLFPLWVLLSSFSTRKKRVGMSSRERFVHVQWPCFCFDLFPSCFLYPSINPAFARERVTSFVREMSISSISFFLSPRLFLFTCYFPITWISTHDCCFRCYSISSCFPNIFLVRIVSWSLQDRVDSCKFYKIIK